MQHLPRRVRDCKEERRRHRETHHERNERLHVLIVHLAPKSRAITKQNAGKNGNQRVGKNRRHHLLLKALSTVLANRPVRCVLPCASGERPPSRADC